MISSPSYGNVGDHLIAISEKEVLHRVRRWKQIELNSIDYPKYGGVLRRLVKKDDVIVLNGGGNIGDTWPETMEMYINRVRAFRDNKIVMFPESWFFRKARSERCEDLFGSFVDSFNNSNLLCFWRDSHSYAEAVSFLHDNTNYCVLDSVFSLSLFRKYRKKAFQRNRVAVCLRDDIERVDYGAQTTFLNSIKQKDVEYLYINNDRKRIIRKNERRKYVHAILKSYSSCSLVITDRLHSMIIAIMLGKPVIVFDNSTSKISHLYSDIREYVSGVYFPKKGDDIEQLIKFVLSKQQSLDRLPLERKINENLKFVEETLFAFVSVSPRP